MDNLYINKVLSGDRQAFSYFIKTYKDMAFSIAISLLKKEHVAEEAVQEAYIQAYLSLANFKMQAKFSTWFYRIVVHSCYRVMQKKQIATVELELTKHDILLDEGSLNKLIQDEKKQVIQEALTRIASNESLALRLFYLEELTIQEVCEITGWTVTNAKVILYRGRKSMYLEINNLLKEAYYG